MNPPPLNIPSSSSVRTVPEENSDTRERVDLTPVGVTQLVDAPRQPLSHKEKPTGRENTVSSKVFTDISKELISQGLTPGTTDYIKAYRKRHYQKNADKKKAYQQEYRERKKKAQVDRAVQMGREYTVSSRVPTGIGAKLISQGLKPGTPAFRQEYQRLYQKYHSQTEKCKVRQKAYRQTDERKASQKRYYQKNADQIKAYQKEQREKKKAQVDSSVQMGRPWDTPSATFRRGAPLQHETSGNEGVNQRMRGAELTSEDEARATERKSQPEELSSGIDGSTIKVEPQEWMGVDDMWVQSLPL
ncbi:hypothetical protein, partial [Photobacterium leiognathi]|uniref:hypothetical protein n=1 Tax=Photobacterium leiognathi TaxID=553611 RepID=UPI00298246DD